MTEADELLDLERATWRAMSTPGEAPAFYDRVLADEVIMLLPGAGVIDDRSTVVDSMRGAGWDDYTLEDERALLVHDDVGIVTYRGQARRGELRYEALFSTTWARADGEWRMAAHQQTPL